MQRIRIPVLVGFAVGAVLAFLVAPSTGLFGRVPLMVLCGVLALGAVLAFLVAPSTGLFAVCR